MTHSKKHGTDRRAAVESKDKTSHRPGSGSSSFSLRRGNAGRRASGNLRKTLYMMRTAFLRRYGRVDVIWHQYTIAAYTEH